MKILPIILCDGSGTRLWPVSRTESPKQLQRLTGEKTMVIEMATRTRNHPECLPPAIICSERYADELEKQFADESIPLTAILTEPMGRDTAAAATCASLWAQALSDVSNSGSPDVLLLLPADHHIGNVEAFHKAISEISVAANLGWIATLGIIPSAPETGLGYIRRTDMKVAETSNYRVEWFVEKPDLATANGYLRSGDYLWNSGMFAFRPETLIDEIQKFAPDVFERSTIAFQDAQNATQHNETRRVNFQSQSFEQIPKISIDFAVMEKTDRATTLPSSIAWSDVGSWRAIYDIQNKDEAGNAISGDCLLHNSTHVLVRAEGGRIVTAIGLDNIAIVDTPDALLISSLDASQDVKVVHKKLGELNNPAAHKVPGLETPSLKMAGEWARDWLFQKAIPIWVTKGLDRVHGGAHEWLPTNGLPIAPVNKRLRVQAHQVYVFSQAALMGSKIAEDAIAVPLDFLTTHGYLGSGRFAHLLGPGGNVVNSKNDCYDLAFVLYALAFALRVDDDPSIRQVADAAISSLVSEFRHPSGGFLENLQNDTSVRRSNPHMHLLEAALAWVELHGDERMANVADEIVELFYTNFFRNGLLHEVFEDDLSSTIGPTSMGASRIEPGHLCEWAYLLSRYRDVKGQGIQPVSTTIAFAELFGKSPFTGLLLDGIGEDGAAEENGTSRLWPQTEYIRYLLSIGGDRNIQKALAHLELTKKYFLQIDGIENGLWTDTADASGVCIDSRAQTSSFNHIMTMMTELLNRAETRDRVLGIPQQSIKRTEVEVLA